MSSAGATLVPRLGVGDVVVHHGVHHARVGRPRGRRLPPRPRAHVVPLARLQLPGGLGLRWLGQLLQVPRRALP
eukprot:1175915-Prorocentrum_minimum.AAC.2